MKNTCTWKSQEPKMFLITFLPICPLRYKNLNSGFSKSVIAKPCPLCCENNFSVNDITKDKQVLL